MPDPVENARAVLRAYKENPEAVRQKYGAEADVIVKRAEAALAGQAAENPNTVTPDELADTAGTQVTLNPKLFEGDQPTEITLTPRVTMGAAAAHMLKAKGGDIAAQDAMKSALYDVEDKTTASGFRGLKVPPSWVPKGASVVSIMQAAWDEPSLEEFHATFPHLSNEGADSKAFQLYKDQRWAADYVKARKLGKPIIRTKYADVLDPILGAKKPGPLGVDLPEGSDLQALGEGTIDAVRALPGAGLGLTSGYALGADEHIASLVDRIGGQSGGVGPALNWVRKTKAESPIASTLGEGLGFLLPGGAAARLGNLGMRGARAVPGLVKAEGILPRALEGALGGGAGAALENTARQGLGVASGSQESFDPGQLMGAGELGLAIGGPLGAVAGAAGRTGKHIRSLPGMGAVKELEGMGGGLGPVGGPRLPKGLTALPDISEAAGGVEAHVAKRLGPGLADVAMGRDAAANAARAATHERYLRSPAATHGQRGWHGSKAILDELERAVDARGVPKGGVTPGNLNRLRRELVQNHEIEAVHFGSREAPKVIPGEGKVMSFAEAERLGVADDLKKIAKVDEYAPPRDTMPDAKAFDDALKREPGRDTNPDPQFSDTMRSAGGPPPDHFILKPIRRSAEEHEAVMTRVADEMSFKGEDSPILERFYAGLEADVKAYPASDSRGGTDLRQLRKREATELSRETDFRGGAGLPDRSLAAKDPEANAPGKAWERLQGGERAAFAGKIGKATDEVMELAKGLPKDLQGEIRTLRARALAGQIERGYKGTGAGVGVQIPGGIPGGIRGAIPSGRRALPLMEALASDAKVSPSVTQKGASLALKVLPENTSISPALYSWLHNALVKEARTLPGTQSTIGLSGGGLAARVGAMKADKDGKMRGESLPAGARNLLLLLINGLPEKRTQ